MQKIIKDKFVTLKDTAKTRVPFLAMLIAAILVALVLLYKTENILNIKTENKNITLHTLSSDVNGVLENLGLGKDNYKIISSEKSGKVTTLSLKKTFPVYINIGIKVKKVKAVESTVGEILDVAGINYDDVGFVEPAVDTVITDTAFIDVTELNFNTIDESEPVIEPEVNEIEVPVISEFQTETPVSITATPVNSNHIYTSFLTKTGGVYRNPYTGLRETYYSQKVLPGGGLVIPGRHVNEEGFVCDGDGLICVASNDFPKGTVVETSRGIGKVYDCGCARGTVDLYVNW